MVRSLSYTLPLSCIAVAMSLTLACSSSDDTGGGTNTGSSSSSSSGGSSSGTASSSSSGSGGGGASCGLAIPNIEAACQTCLDGAICETIRACSEEADCKQCVTTEGAAPSAETCFTSPDSNPVAAKYNQIIDTATGTCASACGYGSNGGGCGPAVGCTTSCTAGARCPTGYTCGVGGICEKLQGAQTCQVCAIP